MTNLGDTAHIEPEDDMATTHLLPSELPVFPLTGALLLPDGTLPLNIFEPRYKNLIEDCLGKGRIMGMLQPKSPELDLGDNEPEIYEIGCAGKIVSFVETGDGRYTITLLGLCRFSVISELPVESGYRRVAPNYKPFLDDLVDDFSSVGNRDGLLNTVQAYFIANEIEANWESIEQADDSALVTTLSMLCPFGPSEKQALLECENTTQRGELLGNLMTLSLHGNPGSHSVRH